MWCNLVVSKRVHVTSLCVVMCACFQARERANVDDDTGMSERERELNQRLLHHATRIVGQPKQYSVRLI